METKVRVVSPEEYTTWLNSMQTMPAEHPGLVILKKNACIGCHSIDGTKLVSATFKGIYGKTEKVITNGAERSIVVDDSYLKTSIFEPDKDLVVGYPKGLMKTYKGLITEEEANKIIEYLKSIK